MTKNKRSSTAPPKWWRTAILLSILTIAVIIWREPLWRFALLVSDQQAISARLRVAGIRGPLVLFLGHLVQVLIAFIPGHFLVIAGGYVYGFIGGFFLNMFAAVFASQFAFLLARRAGRPIVNRFVDEKVLERWYRIGEEQGFLFFTIAFMLPLFPTDTMNYVGGLSGITSWRFLTANILGRIPNIAMFTLIGSHGVNFQPWHWAVILFFGITVVLAGRSVVKRIETRYLDDSPQNSS